MQTQSSKHFKKWLIIIMITVFSILFAGCVGLWPQFTYQGVLTDENGSPLNGSVTITYKLYHVETGGTAFYTENEAVTVTDGRFNSIVGPSTAAGGLSPDDLSQPIWMALTINDGTNTETLSPRQRLYGAPYAFTLMPGTVISATMDETIYGSGGIDAIVSINNEQASDALPALRVEGDRGIELADVGSGFAGTIYSNLDQTSSDIYMYSNDNVHIYLDTDNSESGTFYVYNGANYAQYCYITEAGNFGCTGTKSSITEVDDESHALYAIESPDVWFEDFGSATLENGVVTVPFDPQFSQTVNLSQDYHVFLTPLGDCNGLYVTNKTATGFEVHELGGGTANVSFDYRITAKRAGYESVHLEAVPVSSEEE